MAIITSDHLDSVQGRLQNVIFQTYEYSGKIVIRSKPLKYRDLNSATQRDNRQAQRQAISLMQNWYVGIGRDLCIPPKNYERPNAFFVAQINLMASYFKPMLGNRTSWNTRVLANTNVTYMSDIIEDRLTCDITNVVINSYEDDIGALQLSVEWDTTLNPNDSLYDELIFCIIPTNRPKAGYRYNSGPTRDYGYASVAMEFPYHVEGDEYIIAAGFTNTTRTHHSLAFSCCAVYAGSAQGIYNFDRIIIPKLIF